jgi:membrane protein involved in colicin uptake
MATTTKKGTNNKKTKPRRAVVKAPPTKQKQTIAELRQQLADAFEREKATDKERQEAVEQQKATSEILRVIAKSSNGPKVC